jgi:hypothetical protein
MNKYDSLLTNNDLENDLLESWPAHFVIWLNNSHLGHTVRSKF